MIATQGKTTLTSEQVRELIPHLLFCKDCTLWMKHYPDFRPGDGHDSRYCEGYCKMGLGSCYPDDFCSQGTPRRHTTWADVKRWLDELPEEQLGMIAYVNLANTSQWDGEHEITGLSPWDGDKPVGTDNNLSFNIEED